MGSRFAHGEYQTVVQAAKSLNSMGLLGKKHQVKTVGLSEIEILRAIFMAVEILENEGSQDEIEEDWFDWYMEAVETFNRLPADEQQADSEEEVDEPEEADEPEEKPTPKPTRQTKAKPAPKVEEPEEDDADEPEEEPAPKPTRRRKVKPAPKVEEPEEDADEPDEEPEEDAEPAPKPTRRRKVKPAPKVEEPEETDEPEEEDADEPEEEPEPAPKETRRRKIVIKAKKRVEEPEEDADEPEEEPEPAKAKEPIKRIPAAKTKKELMAQVEEAQEDANEDEVDDMLVDADAPPRTKKVSANGKGGTDTVLNKILANMSKAAIKGEEIDHETMANKVKGDENYVKELRRKACLVMKFIIDNDLSEDDIAEILENEPSPGSNMGRPAR